MTTESGKLFNLIRQRRSVRRFSSQKIDRDILKQCVEAARLAPSAENVQPWRFLIIDDESVKEKLVQHAFTGVYSATRWAAKAPVIVVLLAELDVLANRIGKQITGINYYLIDMGIAGEHFVLQATELGLGTCWIGWFSARGVRKALNLPKKYRPVELLAVGYPDVDKFKDKRRRTLQEICWFNKIER
ncbi:nitroreductase family protein [candidate division KSB1 bacterium]|nr:nitroreductase family protein [candidate division KSB1 bacterium]